MLTAAACEFPDAAASADAQSEASPSETSPSEAPFPPEGIVTDQADLLTDDEAAAITARIASFEETTGHQIAVVTTASLGGIDIGEYTDNLGNAWGVGRAGINDGMVLLLAPNERQARISVADGLLERLPDSMSEQIMQRYLLPNFKRGRYYEGIDSAIDAIIAGLT
jgi:uncharacterized protein